ncbi:Uma2 family endonuclease [Dyadobacter arcticus]|uniref:Uma2 family endonuclease n=1 Tax=Dyadobacter arcticus TaxID=1078754 RepID=A0ABX0UKK2_9BACT|nr:Uma2 family endonuclease [Dyadobacter arcticus]NIJ53553.1 Uma2 family endonuclease [Dyadobacter arcticus]
MNIEMPVTLKMGDLMSEEEFFQFCQMNDTLEFERDSHGNIIVMSPTGIFTGGFNSRILIELGIWNKENQLGEVFDSSTGFTLPNGSVRSPDVSYIQEDRLNQLPKEQQEKFALIYPDFVIEIRSKSDDLKYLLDKMNEYLETGTSLGWLIDRFDKKVYVYQPNQSVVVYDSLKIILSGEPVLPGFTLDLGAVVEKTNKSFR